jgi:hypothetical protein
MAKSPRAAAINSYRQEPSSVVDNRASRILVVDAVNFEQWSRMGIWKCPADECIGNLPGLWSGTMHNPRSGRPVANSSRIAWASSAMRNCTISSTSLG